MPWSAVDERKVHDVRLKVDGWRVYRPTYVGINILTPHLHCLGLGLGWEKLGIHHTGGVNSMKLGDDKILT